jgi:cysteine desulfurase
MIYLDNNATTRPDPTVVEAMLPYWTELYLNPSSVAGDMLGAAVPIQTAKQSLAQLIQAESNEIFLTSGATESNNWVIQSLALRHIHQKGSFRILVSAIEHPSVLETIEALRLADPRISYDLIPVNSTGEINLEDLEGMLSEDADLVSIMLANNESGVIQPIQQAAQIVKNLNPSCIVHTDATQAIGKIPVDLRGELEHVDLLSLSAHKFHGPKGVGALFIRDGISLDPWIHGGNQQSGMRAGTENPALSAGISKAAETAWQRLGSMKAVELLRDKMEFALKAEWPDIRVLGDDAPRLPNTSLLLFPSQEGDMLVHFLLERGVACSTGAACSNGTDRPSHVVTAMGVAHSSARNALRISLSQMSNLQEVETLISTLMEFRESLGRESTLRIGAKHRKRP